MEAEMSDEPFDESAWSEAGIPLDEARHWWAHGLRPEVAAPWCAAGVSPKMAQYFIKHGRAPTEVAREFEQHRADNEPFLDFFRRVEGEANADTINSYSSEHWIDDEALAWVSANIPAPQARVWIEFGISPADASRLIEQGETLATTVRAWWDAGIPSNEMADWIADGCSPAEAATRRAAGLASERPKSE
jgi:hypothetical protein